jgi:hypothetical protein
MAAITSQAAFTLSRWVSATMPKETAPSAATAAHSSFVCIPLPLLASALMKNAPSDQPFMVEQHRSRRAAGKIGGESLIPPPALDLSTRMSR